MPGTRLTGINWQSIQSMIEIAHIATTLRISQRRRHVRKLNTMNKNLTLSRQVCQTAFATLREAHFEG